MKSWENNDNYNFLSYTWLVKELQLEKMCTYLDPINNNNNNNENL